MPRPDAATLDGFVSYIGARSIAKAAATAARPDCTSSSEPRGVRQRHPRPARARDRSTALLPPDDESSGFDNIADVLSVSPSLMERYHLGVLDISRAALGNLKIQPSTITYRVRPDLSQDQHIGRMPRARAAGCRRAHVPGRREYIIKLRMWRNTFDLMRGMEDRTTSRWRMDGARLTVVTAGGREDFGRMAENPGTFGAELDKN